MSHWLRPVAVAAVLTTGCIQEEPLAPDEPTKAEPVKTAEEKPKAAKPSEMITAVKPKELSDAVKKGLTYLAESQQADGGWNQGGGWRTGDGKSGRVEGKDVSDPSDVGNTAFALFAFLRAGHTATDGDYKDVVKKGLAFLCGKVEKSDAASLSVTDVQNTQLQSKIGTHVDTFMASLVLTEFQGKAGEHEKAVAAARDKTLDKIAKHQTEKGEFAKNEGWASNLSWGIANKAISRAKQSGVKVADSLIVRATSGLNAQADGFKAGATDLTTAAKREAAGAYAGGRSGFGGGGGGLGGAPGGSGVGGSTAGVTLYAESQNTTNFRDVRNAIQGDLNKAREVLKDEKATKADKEKAEKVVTEAKKVDEVIAKNEAELAQNTKKQSFVAGFGSNGGEEFLSFLNISETLLVKAGKDWTDWDGKMVDGLGKAQDKNGSWSGHHCITGKTFCTSAALLVLLADRTPFPADVLKDARAVKVELKGEKKEEAKEKKEESKEKK
jgi:hypothetical protein